MSGPEAAAVPALVARLVARVIDSVLVGVAGWALGRVTGYGFAWLGATAALVYAYFVALDAGAGTTAGKAALGLRVIGPDGGRPTWRQAAAREAFVVLGAVPFAGPLLALIAWGAMVVTIRRSPLGQGLHDRLAGGTRVARAAGLPAGVRPT